MPNTLPKSILIYNSIAASVAAADAVKHDIMLGVRKATFVMTTTNNWPNTTSMIDVSADGTNWVTYNKIITNAATTNAQTLTRVATIACNNTTVVGTLDLEHDCFRYIRFYPTRAAGNLTLYLILEYY